MKSKIMVNRKLYDEEVLQEMIDYYERHHQTLNDDMLFNVLLHTDMKDLPFLCHTNTSSIKICQNLNFWKSKYDYHHLPFEVVDRSTKTIEQRIKEYNRIKEAHDVATKLVHYTLDKKKESFPVLTLDADSFKKWDQLYWLTPDIKSNIKNHKYPSDTYFIFDTNHFTIEYRNLSDTDVESVYQIINPDYTLQVDKKTFINYLSSAFFLVPSVGISNNYDRPDIYKLPYVTYQDLLHNTEEAKTFYPEW